MWSGVWGFREEELALYLFDTMKEVLRCIVHLAYSRDRV